MSKVKNLAELKRLPVGTKLKMVRFWEQTVSFDREIVRVQTTGIYMNGTGTMTSATAPVQGVWLKYPKSSELRCDEKGFDIYEAGKLALRYEFV